MSNIYTPGLDVATSAKLSDFRRLGSTYTLKAIATAAGAFAFFTLGPVLPGLIAAGVTAFSFSKLANAHYNAYDSLSRNENLDSFSFGKVESKNAIVHKIESAINFLQLATYKALWEAMKNGVIAKKTNQSKSYQLGVLKGDSEKMMSKEMLGYDLLGAAISILLFVFVPAVGAGSIMAKLAAATLPVLLTGRLADYAKSRVSESINPIEEQKGAVPHSDAFISPIVQNSLTHPQQFADVEQLDVEQLTNYTAQNHDVNLADVGHSALGQ